MKAMDTTEEGHVGTDLSGKARLTISDDYITVRMPIADQDAADKLTKFLKTASLKTPGTSGDYDPPYMDPNEDLPIAATILFSWPKSYLELVERIRKGLYDSQVKFYERVQPLDIDNPEEEKLWDEIMHEHHQEEEKLWDQLLEYKWPNP